MILNPKELNCVEGAEESQFQPNGVDLRVDVVMTLSSKAFFVMSEHEQHKISKQIHEHADRMDWESDEYGEYVILAPGNYYLFDSIEYVRVPEGASGKVIHRSSANRASMRIESGWYDSGFEGFVGGSIQVVVPMKLYKGTRVAQLILWESKANGTYDGQWQGKSSIGI